MDRWLVRIIVVILAIAFVPLIVEGTAKLVAQSVNSLARAIRVLIDPFSQVGDARLVGLVRLCLYLIVVTVLAKFLLGGGRRR